MKTNPSHESLGYVTLTHKGLKHLLSRLPALRYLDVRADADARVNKVALTDVGSLRWSQALSKNRSLTHLCLRRHALGLDAGRNISKALMTNDTLQHLDLSFNIEMGRALGEFATALRSNTSLLELSMNGCFLPNQQLMEFLNALEFSNRTLQSVQLAAPPLTTSPAAAVIQMLKRDWAIQYFTLDDDTNTNSEILSLLQKNRNIASLIAFTSGFHARLGAQSNLRGLTAISPGLLRSVSAFLMG